MTILSHNELLELIDQGVICAHKEQVNGSSIDITLGSSLLIESSAPRKFIVDVANKESITTHAINIKDTGHYLLQPGEFILATSVEVFNLPADISAEYKLKSTMARNGLEHLNAGWCDPGWTESRLTLELKNMTRYHHIKLTPGMKIGQMVFFRHSPVPDKASYAITGQYNNQTGATPAQELK